jgi:hypothetical protein
MAKAPTARKTARATAAPATVATSTEAAPPAAPAIEADVIRMLVGQEGPAVSRVPGQQLTIGADIDAGEAQRLLDADFAERI